MEEVEGDREDERDATLCRSMGNVEAKLGATLVKGLEVGPTLVDRVKVPVDVT